MKKHTSLQMNFHFMEKSLLTRSFLIAVLFLVCINFSSFGAAISFTGASGGNWNLASNWSGNALPTSADDVTISGKTVNVVNNDNVAAGSVTLTNTGTASVGTLTIQSGGTLVVSSTTVSAVQLIVQGGTINNGGTLSVTAKSTQTSALLWMRNTSGSTTLTPSTFNNTGTLTLDASAGGTTATCISLSQTDAGVQPTFTTGGTINLIPKNVNTAFVIDCIASDALINGSGTLSAGTVGTPLIAYFIRILGSNLSLTIDQNVTVNYIGSSSASYGIFIQPTTSGSSTLTNKGTMNLSGTITNPIHLHGNSLTAKFDNQGKIYGTGAPANNSSGLITFQNTTCTMTNSGTINFNPTTDGAVIRAFSGTAVGTFTNTGTITIGSGTTLTNAIILGAGVTSLTNTGTISIGSGNITGTTGTNNATFNNNTNGTLNLTNTTANAILIGNTALSLINGGGTITTGATTNAVIIKTGTPGATFTSGVFSPGGDGNGKINLTNSVSLGGTLKINVTGVTTAGTDYDQIVGSYASTDINISGSTLALTMNALTPADGTSITIINYSSNAGCTVTGTFGSVTGLATGWSVVYTATSVQLKFTKITPTVTVSVGTYTYNGSAQGPSTLSSPSSPQASSITYSYSGTGSTTYGPTSTMPTNAGTYTVTATVNSDSYYNSASSGAVSFSINKATPTLTVSNTPVTYDGSAHSATASASGGGSVSNILTGGAASQTNAGTYTVTADVAASSNYNAATGVTATNSFVINKATPTLTVSNTPVTYDGSAHSATASASGGGTVSNISTGGAASQTNAGTYTVTADIAASSNYNAATGVTATNSFVINKATPTLTVSNTPVTYDGSAHSATASASGGGTVSNISTGGAASQTNAGTYTVTADIAASTNYNAATGVTATNSFVINKATPSISVSGTQSFTYNSSSQGPATVSYNGDGTPSLLYTSTDGGGYSSTTAAPSNVGTYQVVYSATVGTNYNAASTSAYPFTIYSTGVVSAANTNVSSLLLSTASDISITGSGSLVIDANASVHSVTAAPGTQLTISSGKSLSVSGNLQLQSDASGTATFIDNTSNGLTVSGNTTVQQYLNAAHSRNWYISSPVSTATAQSGFSYYKRDEPTNNWLTMATGDALTSGMGYIANPASAPGTYSFTGGSLNNGSVPVTLAYSGSGVTKAGFNLVGNPYPSHITLTKAATDAASALNTIWYRTVDSYDAVTSKYVYAFKTCLINADGTYLGTPDGTAPIIAPMQAFWVRTSVNNSTLTFTNAMRSHQSSNPLKAPAKKDENMQILRLQVSNGLSTDETVLYSNVNASNSFDEYDAPKMFNNSTVMAEIYTLSGAEQLAINGLNQIPYDTEIPLGFNTLSSGNFSIKASQFSNFGAGTQMLLHDYQQNMTQDLTVSDYSFTSNAVSTSTRFTLIFHAPSITSGLNPESWDNLSISTRNGQIVVNGIVGDGAKLEVYNTVGQKIMEKNLTGTGANNCLPTGVYLLKVTQNGRNLTRKIIID